MKKILIAGGAGYIGSQTVKALNSTSKYKPVVFDNLSSGHKEAVLSAKLIVGDIADKNLLSQVIKEEKIEAVLNFAGYIDVGESVREPAKYLQNNCLNAHNIVEAMLENGANKFIFSSTAAVYGEPEEVPITEDAPTNPTNPYGLSKLLFEKVLEFYRQFGLEYISLRYFNAAGADIDGEIGDDHANKTHLTTSAILTALGLRNSFNLFGTDYDTEDGTCIRDYIHVTDLASAHVLALDYLFEKGRSDVFNLGNGRGFSNRQVLETVKKISGNNFKIIEAGRREGDPKILVASSQKAKKILGWKPQCCDLDVIIQTAYDWHKSHPHGYSPRTS